jgi:hypothetical protein
LRLLVSSNICISGGKERRKKSKKRREESRSGTERGERKRGRESLKQDEGSSGKMTTQVSTQSLETTQARQQETLETESRKHKKTTKKVDSVEYENVQ